MKLIAISCGVLLLVLAGPAAAQCAANTRVTGNALSTTLSNRLVCGQRAGAPANANNRWQEEHLGSGGGQLVDFKLGPGHPVDPREQVGSWSLTANVVTHNYTGGGVFSWTLHDNGGGNFSFCTGVDGTQVVKAFIVAINPGAGCGGTFPAP